MNYPPLHPHCRSSTSPVIDGLVREGLQRRGRDADGKGVLLPRDMNYAEWKRWQEGGAPADVVAWRLSKGEKPATISLSDQPIYRSVGAKARNYDIQDPQTGEVHRFAEGTKIQDRTVFAGYGTRNPLHDGVADGLATQFGGVPERWQKAKGEGVIDYKGENVRAEVHWFQEETVGQVRHKIKEWLE